MAEEASEDEKKAEEDVRNDSSYSLKEVFARLNEAEKFYEKKEYEEAVEAYSWALERLVEVHGEANLVNTDVIYAYGQALFHLAVKKSGVFGGSVSPLKEVINAGSMSSVLKTGSNNCARGTFSFSGDESSEEEEDDFGIAWETLDFARILYQKMLDAIENQQFCVFSEFQEVPDKQEIQKKLSNTYDLLGEISLENENFQQASIDFQYALNLKSQIYPLESSLISEAHYKLALAFEFLKDDDMREKAIEHVGWAIKSLEKRIEIEQQSEKGKEKLTKKVEDMQEMLSELRQKIEELQKPPSKQEITALEFEDMIEKSQKNMKRALSEIISNANDVNALVKKKKKEPFSKIQNPCNESMSIEKNCNKKD
ncbi:hypothetical protein PORY_000590 [Pneumocystis oryctolagi]|uniref:Uncharacterized protein n=1 Tax=Pneumocystis oryctolagi TaxID=42067 RepID=A0ACB7CF36_9ASCO|nr:hypothetical protein PORY_000590 [Pneumocystis oryctolagi]